MAIYDKNSNTLIIAENELNIKMNPTKEEVYMLGYEAGFKDGYDEAESDCNTETAINAE